MKQKLKISVPYSVCIQRHIYRRMSSNQKFNLALTQNIRTVPVFVVVQMHEVAPLQGWFVLKKVLHVEGHLAPTPSENKENTKRSANVEKRTNILELKMNRYTD